MRKKLRCSTIAMLAVLAACTPQTTQMDAEPWQVVAKSQPEAFLSVSGTSDDDVWFVGADHGTGPAVIHFDGQQFHRHATGHRGDLWWVQAFPNHQAILAGSDGAVLRFDGVTFERLSTPGLGRQKIFGLWGAHPNDVWFVGGAAGRDGFVWRYQDGVFVEVPLPLAVPRRSDGELPSVLKVFGQSAQDVWFAGDRGLLLHYQGGKTLDVVPLPTSERLFTVHGFTKDASAQIVAVGGNSQALIVESRSGLAPRTIPQTPLLQGVYADPKGSIAVGQFGTILEQRDEDWVKVDPGVAFPAESLHAVYRAPSGSIWTVGGNVLSAKLDAGVVMYRPSTAQSAALPVWPDSVPVLMQPPSCPKEDQDPFPSASIARRWNEQILSAIRRDLPRPTVHARNLFHLSAALYDVWASYDKTALGYLYRDKKAAPDLAIARREAMSYAAYRILTARYEKAIGGSVSAVCFEGLMRKLGYDPRDGSDQGDSPRALGNRIATLYLSTYASDGSNEQMDYADNTNYQSINSPLEVDLPSVRIQDPARWQPLNLSVAATQNGIILPAGVQKYIGAHWGQVTPFALNRKSADELYIDPGMPPGFDHKTMREWVLEVISKTRQLDVRRGAVIDISPGAMGGNPLGTNAGKGYTKNPVTGLPYAPNFVKESDFGRVLAEHWADGPKSETPPGHWNVIANRVSDHPACEHRLSGMGPVIDRLEWDTKLYFAINGALHDAAISAWQIKRRFDAARPMSLIRYMAAQGQSTEPGKSDYSAQGLPLIQGLIERITVDSSRPGARHAHLAHFVGELAIVSWRGEPGHRRRDIGGVDWIRAAEWIPYQRRNFVTPAFPGFISGHSTFSRAAAEVLCDFTGSPFFPGGIASYSAEKDTYLQFERGPETSLRLEWATYYDAADQAGQSRIWGGIHIAPDDFGGRKVGATVGLAAIARARKYYDGSMPLF